MGERLPEGLGGVCAGVGGAGAVAAGARGWRALSEPEMGGFWGQGRDGPGVLVCSSAVPGRAPRPLGGERPEGADVRRG